MGVEILAGDLHFAEGPRWHQGKLWFSDFYDHAVKTVDLDGLVETKVVLDDQPSGLGWMPDGRLLIVSMHQRVVLRLEYDTLVVHGDLGNIATFHCNDMVVDAFGRAYVGNFGFDLDAAITGGNVAAELAAYDGAAIARIDPNGMIHSVATHLRFPNGMVITPDGGTMIVAETLGRQLTAFDIGIDGSLTNQRVWAPLESAAPDGICLDQQGGVWVADASGPRCVRVVEGGAITDVVDTSQPCYACMLGGPDGRTLFMLTCESSLPAIAGSRRTARIETTTVAVGHAGLP